MSNYCTHCGAQLEEDAKFCAACGMAADEVSEENHPGRAHGVCQQAAAILGKIRSDARLKWIVPVAAAAIILSIVLCIVLLGGGGYKGMVKKVVAAIEEQDVDALMDLSSDLYYGRKDDYEECEYFYNREVENLTEHFEEEVGRRYTLKYEIDSVRSATKKEKDAMLEGLSYEGYDEKAIKAVKEIKIVSVILTAKNGRRSEDQEVTMTVAKEKGGWKLLGIEAVRSGIWW